MNSSSATLPSLAAATRWLCALLLATPVAAAAQIGSTEGKAVSAVTGSNGAAVSAALPAQAVLEALALARQAALVLAPAGARVEVVAGALDSRLQLAPCAQVQVYQSPGMPAWGRTRVGLRCTQGSSAWNVFVPMSVQVWAPAVVSTAALPAGARLETNNLALAETDWAATSSAPFAAPEGLAGRVLTRPLPAGQALRQTDLQPRQWFALGDRVRVDARGAGFAVSAEGQALTPGLEGQIARVRTDNGRVLTGRPVADRQLEVKL